MFLNDIVQKGVNPDIQQTSENVFDIKIHYTIES